MNKQIWELYKTSEKGKKIIELFDTQRDDFDVEKLFGYFESLGHTNFDADSYLYYFLNFEYNQEEKNFLPDSLEYENYADFIEKYELSEYTFDDNDNPVSEGIILDADDGRGKMWYMNPLSIYLFVSYLGFAYPILFPRRFDIFQRNCDALGITLPDVPHTKDYWEYTDYYWDLCAALSDFQDENNLTRAELCAAIYDFAPMLIDKQDNANEPLPQPTNVWLTGAGGENGDFEGLNELAENPSIEGESIWTCNERTRRGDIIIFYATKPYSGIYHVGRAKTEGFTNPFDYYKHSTTVCNVVKLDVPILLKDLKTDDYMKTVSIVRQGMRGVNGKEFSSKDYAEFLRLERQKGGNTAQLPELYQVSAADFGTLKVEKDVEEKILIPYLKKIGYDDGDWTRQLSIKAGRGEKAIPDFAFFAQGARHFESAPFVVEAKFNMLSSTERRNAFSQCLSYARLLRSKLMAICDKERMIVFNVSDSGFADYEHPAFEGHWAAIYSDGHVGQQLKKLISHDVVKGL